MLGLAVIVNANSDIYDFDNSKYMKAEKEKYSKLADGNKEKLKCIKNALEVKHIKKCVK